MGAINQTAFYLSTLFIGLLIGAGYSFSDEQCQYPNVFGTALAPPANHVGEFRITLELPDYSHAASVQRHLAFSTVLASLLRSELATQTSGRCRAVMSLSLYPDLRVFLIENKSAGSATADSSPCIRALQDLLLKLQPNNEEISKASSLEAKSRERSMSDPGGDSGEAADILRRALMQIYDVDTVMRALVSIAPNTFQSLEGNAFVHWLRRQQSNGSVTLQPLRLCRPEVGPMSPANADGERLPHSSVIPPGTLKVSIVGDQPAVMRSLRHVVVVGEGPAVNFSRSTNRAIDKFCNREHVFSADPNSVSRLTKTVRIRCLRTVQYGAGWTVFYCDPVDCAFQQLAEAVVAQIAIDPDVLSLAKGLTANQRSVGPYVIGVEVKSQ